MLHIFEGRVFPFLTALDSHCEHLNELLEPWAKLRWSIFNLLNLSSQNQCFSDFSNRDPTHFQKKFSIYDNTRQLMWASKKNSVLLV